MIQNKQYILGTTILDTKFTVKILANLYHKRWDIETYFQVLVTK